MISSYVNRGGKTTVRDDKLNRNIFYNKIYTIEPQTHSPTQRDFSSVYASMSDEYDVIFSLHSSLSLTSIYLKASKVATEQEFGTTRIHVYDTGQISGGLSVIVRAVADMITRGCSEDEIKEAIPNFIKRASFLCIIPSDKYIKHSENLNRNHLKLKTNSILSMNQGMVVMGKQQRKMFSLFEQMQDRILSVEPDLVSVSHSITPKENFNKKNTYPYFLWGDIPEDAHNLFIGEGFNSIMNVMNPSLISHLGMGTIGIGYLSL